MKRFLIALMFFVLCCGPSVVLAGYDYTGAEYVPGHLIVGFTNRLGHSLNDIDGHGQVVKLGISSVDDLFTRYNVTKAERLVSDKILGLLDFPPDFYRTMVLICPDNTDILKMLADFEQDPNVETAQPDLLSKLYDRVPNDQYWNNQWDKVLMHCPAVWDFSTGSREIKVVAVDVGTWWKHADFHDNLWINPSEDITHDSVAYTDTTYPGDQADIDGEDNDGDGLIDDMLGWDFIHDLHDCWPGEDCDGNQDNDPVSLEDHGTHVLGLMGAVGNNTIGVSGVNWNIKLISSRAGYRNNQGEGRIVTTASVPCMLWAVGKGARVVNMSYGSAYNNPTEATAITACWNQGALMVAAAGNDHLSSPHFPAANPNTIAVGSVDPGDIVSDFSNYGTWVDIFSPGNMVMSTVIPGYIEYPGTSMASPNAAGVMALLWSLFPTMTNQQLMDFVFANCKDITTENPTYTPQQLGHGRIDAMLPLASVRPSLSVAGNSLSGDNDQDGRLEAGETGDLAVTIANNPDWASAENVQVTISTDDPNLSLSNASFGLGTIPPGGSAQNTANPVHVTVAASIPDAYWATLNVSMTADGGFILQRTITLRIGRPQTLLVADDGADVFHNYFARELSAQGYFYNYDMWSTTLDGDLALANLTEYQIVIWVCGNENNNTLTAADRTMLSQWLDSGNKRLLLAGQNIDEDISGTPFYSDYLHSQSAGATTTRNLRGVDGDVISDGTSLLLIGGACAGNGAVSPSKISAANGGTVFFNYGTTGTEGGGAIRFSNDTYKVAYFAFAIEAACGLNSTTYYGNILRNVMEWFGATPTNAEPRQTSTLPAGYALNANYPNPFNPVTTLSFDLPRVARVNLTIFDMLGREVTTLVSGSMPAGSHTVTFDGSSLASGTYLAHFQADGFSATQKMLLLK